MRGTRPLSDDEVSRVYQHGFTGRKYEKRERCLFAIGVCTGFRISELLSLRVKDVFQKGVIMGYVKVDKINMKGKKEGRAARLTEEARKYTMEWILELQDWRLKQDKKFYEDLFLFQSREGWNKPITYQTARLAIKTACESQGIVEPNGLVSTHSMRKTFAKRIYQYFQSQYREGQTNHEPIIMTYNALGHASIENTMKYLSFMASEIPESVLNIVKPAHYEKKH